MTRLFLVRHGDAVWSLDEMRPLSALGWQQAEAVADALAPLAPAALCSSPWARARQTIEPLAARLGLAIETIPDLRERQLTDRPVEDFAAASRATWDDFSYAHAGGESNLQAQRRAVAAIGEIAARHSGERVIVATHGTLLALILNAHDDSIGFDFWRRITTPDIYRLDFGQTPAAIRRVSLLPDAAL